jgi:hypothetical protein
MYNKGSVWATYKNTNTIKELPLICGQQNARASSESNTGHNMAKDTETQKHSVRTYRGMIVY